MIMCGSFSHPIFWGKRWLLHRRSPQELHQLSVQFSSTNGLPSCLDLFCLQIRDALLQWKDFARCLGVLYEETELHLLDQVWSHILLILHVSSAHLRSFFVLTRAS